MFSSLSCFYLSYTLPICGLFYLVLLASTLSRYSLFCADGTLTPFHSLTHWNGRIIFQRHIYPISTEIAEDTNLFVALVKSSD